VITTRPRRELPDAVADQLGDWSWLPADMVNVRFEPHCVEQFVAKCRGGRMSIEEGRRELSALLGDATVTRDPPDWLERKRGRCAAFLRLPRAVCLLERRVSGERLDHPHRHQVDA
jgi:hypothetical protein